MSAAVMTLIEAHAAHSRRALAFKRRGLFISQGPLLLRNAITTRFKSQKAAASALQVNESMVSAWLSGRRRPSLNEATLLQLVLAVDAAAWGLAPAPE